MKNTIVCENYEICLAEAGLAPVVTFDVDDITVPNLAWITRCALHENSLVIGLAESQESSETAEVSFPFYEGIREIFADIKNDPGKLMIIALGADPNDATQSVVAYGGEFTLN